MAEKIEVWVETQNLGNRRLRIYLLKQGEEEPRRIITILDHRELPEDPEKILTLVEKNLRKIKEEGAEEAIRGLLRALGQEIEFKEIQP